MAAGPKSRDRRAGIQRTHARNVDAPAESPLPSKQKYKLSIHRLIVSTQESLERFQASFDIGSDLFGALMDLQACVSDLEDAIEAHDCCDEA